MSKQSKMSNKLKSHQKSRIYITIAFFVLLGIILFFFTPSQILTIVKGEAIELVKQEAKQINKSIKDATGLNVKVEDFIPSDKISSSKKNIEKLNTNNSQNEHFQDVKNYQPKGNKPEFCQANTLNGVFPLAHKGFGNNLISLCYSGYAAQYKPDYFISLWTAEKLTKERELKSQNGEREDGFYPDPNIISQLGEKQAIKTEDYIGASNGEKDKTKLIRYDRGHLSPSRDMPLDDRYESFYMSNIVPQSAENNRNIWKNIESLSRCYAMKYNEVYVVNVPVIDISYYQKNNLPMNKLQTKRGHQIQIPDYMAKGIYIPSLNQIGVFLTKNNKDKDSYEMITVNQLKKLSFIDIFPQLSDELKNTVNLKNQCVLKK